jgi:hypothetical protein
MTRRFGYERHDMRIFAILGVEMQDIRDFQLTSKGCWRIQMVREGESGVEGIQGHKQFFVGRLERYLALMEWLISIWIWMDN